MIFNQFITIEVNVNCTLNLQNEILNSSRTLHVWDAVDGKVRNVLSPPTLREYSFTSIAQSARHLFLGTTGASVSKHYSNFFCVHAHL